MFPTRDVADPDFARDCVPVVPAEDASLACGEQRRQSCGAPSLQNSHQDLLDLIGPARVDDRPPTVTLQGGIEALAAPLGMPLQLVAEAHDDALVDRVDLYLDGEYFGTDSEAPFGWTLDGTEVGEFEFYVEAFDTSGNSTLSEPITVYLGTEPPEGVDAQSPFANPDDLLGPQADTGCTCTTSPTPTPLACLLLLLLPLAFRRR
jgi:hypothetical protein